MDTTNRDRETTWLEITQTPYPAPPLNCTVSHVSIGIVDLRFDNPADQEINGNFQIWGCNVYRSFDSEYGPYQRLNDLPICSGFYRDQTDNEWVEQPAKFLLWGEDQSAAGSSAPRWVIKTEDKIVLEGSQAIISNDRKDVRVWINDQPARILRVIGWSGEIEIDPHLYVDVNTQRWDPSLVPNRSDTVRVQYRRNRNLVRTDLGQRIFYRVTTVGMLNGCLVETPLELSILTNLQEIEKLDYIWKEAVRRNRYILEQGGERAQAMIRKHTGIPCGCIQDAHHHQPLNDCPVCYSSGYVGGFEGPYEILIAPDDGERKITQTELGRTLEHSYEVWTGPTPMLSHRDFIIRLNGDRYSIGAVRFPTNRGMVLQQHFQIGHLDQHDIRYRVPLDRERFWNVEQYPVGPEREANSVITEKANIPDGRELRGRTKAWETIQW